MVVERQGHMECALATIGALGGRALEDVRHIAHEEAARARMPFYKHRVLAEIARRVGGDRMVALTGFNRMPRSPLESTSDVRIMGPRTRVLPRKGRGVVRVHLRRTFTQGHIMPWADGFLYDPVNPERPMTLAEYRRENPHWSLSYVTHATGLDTAQDLG